MSTAKVDPYVKGWLDCAETIARLCEIKARDCEHSTLRKRGAIFYRHAAEIARATTKIEREER